VAYRRVRRFAWLIAKLGLDAAEVGIAFQDQDLAGTFPEPLALPPGVDHIDALLEDSDGTVYVFGEPGFWTYAAGSYLLADPQPKPLTALSSRFTGMSTVDAAFTDAAGTSWIVGHSNEGGSRAFTKERGSHHWTHRDQLWGRIKNNFADPERIDTAFVDDEGRTYLFCGNQYVRYSTSDYSYVDEGYPRTLGEWREDEGPHVRLAANFQFALDASFQGPDGRVHLFKEDRFRTVGGEELPIAEFWGQVRNAFDDAEQLDAAYTDGATQLLFSGQHVVGYSDCIENDGVRVDDGSPKRIEALLHDVPPEFEHGIDAALVDGDGVVHLFKDGKTVALTTGPRVVEPTAQRWGVLGPVLPSGTVDAAFVGLDGKTYLFSGEWYIRYAGADYTVVDAGYPRRIAGDWGGLGRVDAAFVLDDRTYVFGMVGETPSYVRYSTRVYTTPDEGYPKPLSDNWWNLPAELVPEFRTVDAVFTGRDKLTYLFSGKSSSSSTASTAGGRRPGRSPITGTASRPISSASTPRSLAATGRPTRSRRGVTSATPPPTTPGSTTAILPRSPRSGATWSTTSRAPGRWTRPWSSTRRSRVPTCSPATSSCATPGPTTPQWTTDTRRTWPR
jgi:hypothetical protein